jgi:hypothetical protein
VQQCRGIVFDGDTLVVQSFGYIHEFVAGDPVLRTIIDDSSFTSSQPLSSPDKDNENEDNENEDNENEDTENMGRVDEKYRIFKSHEGTLLRTFCHNGRWRTSTHRRLDASKSKWSSRESFQRLFEQALQTQTSYEQEFDSREDEKVDNDEQRETQNSAYTALISRLNPDRIYLFLLKSSGDNVIVCTENRASNQVYHVGTVDVSTGNVDLDCYEPRIAHPEELTSSLTSLDDVNRYVESVDITQTQGVVVHTKTNVAPIKIVSTEYKKFADIRGNVPSIAFRYVQLLNDVKRRMLMHMYPWMTGKLEAYENAINRVARFLESAYVSKYIKKQDIFVEPDEYRILKCVHEKFKESRRTRTYFKVNSDVIKESLAKFPTVANRLVKAFHYTTVSTV